MRKEIEMNAMIRVSYHKPYVVIQMPPALSQVIEIRGLLAVVVVTTASDTLSMIMSAKGISNRIHWCASPFSQETLILQSLFTLYCKCIIISAFIPVEGVDERPRNEIYWRYRDFVRSATPLQAFP